ncbi:MAG TPA: type II toxin-antitoxin system RelE/ParE family toxin [Vineibacter sp.]|nr:type II toxin-antitoxin system RelE/ParE family toxin [Vineibacter sp.]
MRLEWSAEALVDLGEQVRFVQARNPAAARKIAQAVYTAAERLAVFPRIGRPGQRDGTREWSVTRLPYIIVYAVDDDLETILHVYHVRQRR